MNSHDVISKFQHAMQQANVVCSEQIISDGILRRFTVEGDKVGSNTGWYVLAMGRFPWGNFGCWRRGIDEDWILHNYSTLTNTDRRLFNEEIAEAKKKSDAVLQATRAEAREHAQQIWEKASTVKEHAYLVKKGIPAIGIREYKGKLVIPLFDQNGQLHSLQLINEAGEKRFLIGGETRGHYFCLGDLHSAIIIYLCEGFSTGVTIHQITNCSVVVAFSANNLLPVIKVIHSAYPDKEIIVASDNDQWTPNNPGLSKAREAADAVQTELVWPCFDAFDTSDKPTDYNDLIRIAGIDEVKRQLSSWPDPEPIQAQLLPVEVLPSLLIPEPLREYVIDVAERMQCPIDFVAVTAIAVIASVVGTGCGIKPKQEDNWLVIPNLWGCIVGRPGIMKTPAVSEIMQHLEKLQAEAKKNLDADMAGYQVEMECYKAKREAVKSQLVTTEKNRFKKNTSADLSSEVLKTHLIGLTEPKKPIWRRFKTNDATIEKLNELLSENPRGLLVYRDELTGLLKTCEKSGHESDRAFFLESWNGDGQLTSDRIGRGTVHTENLCLSIFGTTQPDKLMRYLYGAVYGDNDGLIQRFQLLVFPDETKDWKRVDRKPNYDAKKKVFAIVKALSEMDFVQHGASKDEGDKFSYFRFNVTAQEIFYEWWEDLERNKLRSDDHPLLIEHFSKYRKLMPALALLFHLIDLASGNPSSNGISPNNVKLACAWCDYLESHARRIYGMVIDVGSQAASLLSEKIRQGKLKNGFCVRDIYRQNWSLLKEKAIVELACSELVDAGWLRPIPSADRSKGKITYKINPKILKGVNDE